MKSSLIRAVALFCCVSLLGAQSVVPPTIKEKAVTIPIGSVVEAKLTQKRGKVKGQLLSVSESGVTIRTVESGNVKERSVAFSDMQQFQNKKGSGTAIKILAGVGIGVTGLILILIAFSGA